MASVGIISNYVEIPKNLIVIDSHTHHENFKKEWKDLVKRFDKAKGEVLEIDKEKATKLISNLVNDVAELIHFNSSLVTVRSTTFGTSKKLYEHYLIHITKEIFTKEGVSLVGNDIDNLLKFAELIYTDDSIIRFLPELKIKPKDAHEKEISVIGSPKEILNWVFDVEKMYYRFLNKKIKKDELLKTIAHLYDEKNSVVKTAIEMKIFLPISPRNISSEDKNYLYNHMKRDWTRNKKIDSDFIINYLYLNEIENLKEIGFILDD